MLAAVIMNDENLQCDDYFFLAAMQEFRLMNQNFDFFYNFSNLGNFNNLL